MDNKDRNHNRHNDRNNDNRNRDVDNVEFADENEFADLDKDNNQRDNRDRNRR